LPSDSGPDNDIDQISTEQDAYYYQQRVPGRFYVSRRFGYTGHGRDDASAGRASRFAFSRIDGESDVVFESENGWDVVLRSTPTGQQLKALFFEDDRSCIHLSFQRFKEGRYLARESFALHGPEVGQLLAFIDLLHSNGLLLENDGSRMRFSSELVRQMVGEDGSALQLARANPELLRTLIETDVGAPDVIALARRRQVLERFGDLLHDPYVFAKAQESVAGPEAVWQRFFEDNPWIVTGNLAPQFLHSFDPDRLEQVIRGSSVIDSGRRADALLRTAGRISSVVLVEIKHHNTPLLANTPYRTSLWRVDNDVLGGVAQCQAEVHSIERQWGSQIPITDTDGFVTGRVSVCRPRSILVVGSLGQFTSDEGEIHPDRYECFERFRRSLRDPEIITFDELFDRATMLLDLAVEDDGLEDETSVIENGFDSTVATWNDEEPF
jgi:hypothetical protein